MVKNQNIQMIALLVELIMSQMITIINKFGCWSTYLDGCLNFWFISRPVMITKAFVVSLPARRAPSNERSLVYFDFSPKNQPGPIWFFDFEAYTDIRKKGPKFFQIHIRNPNSDSNWQNFIPKMWFHYL